MSEQAENCNELVYLSTSENPEYPTGWYYYTPDEAMEGPFSSQEEAYNEFIKFCEEFEKFS